MVRFFNIAILVLTCTILFAASSVYAQETKRKIYNSQGGGGTTLYNGSGPSGSIGSAISQSASTLYNGSGSGSSAPISLQGILRSGEQAVQSVGSNFSGYNPIRNKQVDIMYLSAEELERQRLKRDAEFFAKQKEYENVMSRNREEFEEERQGYLSRFQDDPVSVQGQEDQPRLIYQQKDMSESAMPQRVFSNF